MHLAYLMLMAPAILFVIYRGLERGPRHTFPLLACAGAVVLNWAANTGFVMASGDTDPELVFLLTDAASAYIVIRHGQGLVTTAGSMLLASYAGQILMHLIHIGTGSDPLYYWKILTLLGYGQLGLILGWALAYREPGHGFG